MGPKRSFTVQFKLNAIKWHQENGIIVSATARTFNVDRKRIREWLENEDLLRQNRIGKKSQLRKLHPGE